MIWDVTVVSTLAGSYVDTAARGAGAVAELAANRKCEKYTDLANNFIFQPIAVENLGPMNISALEFLCDLGHKLSSCSGDDREPAFLFQRISVAVQRFNAVLLHDTLVDNADPDQ